MGKIRGIKIAWATGLLLAAGCGGGGGGGNGGPDGGPGGVANHLVKGTVVDFVTGEALASATVSTDGLMPAPTVSVTGADFTIEDVPPFSVFHILAGSPPDYRSTYNVATDVEDADVTGLEISAVSEAFLADLTSEFGVTPTSGTAVMIGRLVDDAGKPVSGVPADAFELDASVAGPFFLDADRQPDSGLTASSDSGYFVLFDVPAGLVSVSAAEGSGVGMTMPDSPTAATAATLAEVVVTNGELPQIPTNVSFSNDVIPIFEARGCTSCHDGSGIGKDLGGLHLNGSVQKTYSELTEEISPNHGTTRVNLETPEESLVLTMPSREDPPDEHPNVTFTSQQDPDYLTILGWITEGALNN